MGGGGGRRWWVGAPGKETSMEASAPVQCLVLAFQCFAGPAGRSAQRCSRVIVRGRRSTRSHTKDGDRMHAVEGAPTVPRLPGRGDDSKKKDATHRDDDESILSSSTTASTTRTTSKSTLWPDPPHPPPLPPTHRRHRRHRRRHRQPADRGRHGGRQSSSGGAPPSSRACPAHTRTPQPKTQKQTQTRNKKKKTSPPRPNPQPGHARGDKKEHKAAEQRNRKCAAKKGSPQAKSVEIRREGVAQMRPPWKRKKRLQGKEMTRQKGTKKTGHECRPKPSQRAQRANPASSTQM